MKDRVENFILTDLLHTQVHWQLLRWSIKSTRRHVRGRAVRCTAGLAGRPLPLSWHSLSVPKGLSVGRCISKPLHAHMARVILPHPHLLFTLLILRRLKFSPWLCPSALHCLPTTVAATSITCLNHRLRWCRQNPKPSDHAMSQSQVHATPATTAVSHSCVLFLSHLALSHSLDLLISWFLVLLLS